MREEKARQPSSTTASGAAIDFSMRWSGIASPQGVCLDLPPLSDAPPLRAALFPGLGFKRKFRFYIVRDEVERRCTMVRLSGIRRGVKDPGATASWIGWLLDVEPKNEEDQFRFECANGWLIIHGDFGVPVGVDLAEADASSREPDPDGVPVDTTSGAGSGRRENAVSLDHVRLNCADLAGTVEFYRRLGFTLTWSGRGDDELDGPQETPLEGAGWVHLSGADGYLSLSQADWQDYGRHSTASGPPRFIHIGLAVPRLQDVVERLHRAGVHYLRGHPAVGKNLYVNDPDGEPRLGTNVEIMEYEPGVSRSGQLTPE